MTFATARSFQSKDKFETFSQPNGTITGEISPSQLDQSLYGTAVEESVVDPSETKEDTPPLVLPEESGLNKA